jgi:hypothetical protein
MDNETAAHIAIECAHELWYGKGCAMCDDSYFEMHEIYGRQFRKHLGALCCALGVTLIPVCKKHHAGIEKLTLEQQLHIVHTCQKASLLRQIKIDHLIALKARLL